jgi:hypothetical protein
VTCHHRAGDPNCSSTRAAEERGRRSATPDAENYEIEEAEAVGQHLVLRVRYPNCEKCSYEGHKVMVFLNTNAAEALKWKRIDPHFREDKGVSKSREAPSPAARFPASPEGWQDALTYARVKLDQRAS